MNQMTSEAGKASDKVPRHLETLATSVFHGLFPPINPQVAPLKSIRRVLLLNRERSSKNDGFYVINFRHYAITTKVTGVSKAVKRLNAAERLMNSKSRKGKLPNLNKLQDIADYMIGGENGDGYVTDATSGSEVDTDAEVEVMEPTDRKKVAPRRRPAAAAPAEEDSDDDEAESKAAAHGADKVERRAVKLVELGPRMKLRLTKVEEGLCSGKVLWHEYIHKTKEEIKELEKTWEKRRQEKEARRKEQKENVEKKRAAKKARGKKDGEKSDDDDEMDLDDLGSDAYDYMDEDGFDSEGLEGDAEAKTNEQAEEDGEWSDEEEEIANGR